MKNERKQLQRLRAEAAYEETRAWKNESWRIEATRRIKGLPVQIRTQGLTTVVALLMREDTQHSRRIAYLLARWLLKDSPQQHLPWPHKERAGESYADRPVDPRGLLQACIEADRATYLGSQAEALAFIGQVKLLADALYTEEAKAKKS